MREEEWGVSKMWPRGPPPCSKIQDGGPMLKLESQTSEVIHGPLKKRGAHKRPWMSENQASPMHEQMLINMQLLAIKIMPARQTT